MFFAEVIFLRRVFLSVEMLADFLVVEAELIGVVVLF